VNRATYSDCRGCRRRYADLPADGLCGPCHNGVIDNEERAKGKIPRRQWCGKCDERTRLMDFYDGDHPYRCPRCHPLASRPLRSVA
jgi:hypothetical protein